MFEEESKRDLESLISDVSSQIRSPQGDIGLVEYAKETVEFDLDPWQELHLLPLLQRFSHERRLRLMIHAPPQHGKSVFVSTRLPGYLLGCDALAKICLCAFNEEKATDFSNLVIDTLNSNAHKQIFGNESLPEGSKGSPPSAKAWRTSARKRIADTQVSLRAVGLSTGIVSSGFDHVIIDDPYASYEDSTSEAHNRKLWYFYTRVLKPRLGDANMMWMFHRWHHADIIGKILEEEPDEWLYVRFPAIADDNLDGSDPTGRLPGELLSPRKTMEDYKPIIEKDPGGWMGLFQGTPSLESGGLIRPECFKYIDKDKLPEFKRYYRAWDLAASKDKARDFTAGALMTNDGEDIYIHDVVRFQEEWPDAHDKICEVAENDPPGTVVLVEQVALSIAMVQSLRKSQAFRRRPIIGVRTHKDKRVNASDWAKRASNGNIYIVRGDWNAKFADECRIFDGLGLSRDDQVDAVSIGHKMIWSFGPGIKKHEQKPPWLSHAWLREMRRNTRNAETAKEESYGSIKALDQGDTA